MRALAGLRIVWSMSYSHVLVSSTTEESNNGGTFNEPPPLNRLVNSSEDKVNARALQ